MFLLINLWHCGAYVMRYSLMPILNHCVVFVLCSGLCAKTGVLCSAFVHGSLFGSACY